MNFVTGHKKILQRLQKMRGAASERRIGKALFAGAEEIAVEAQLSITNGAVSGAGHVPSAPGEPPNNDTGTLAGNIEAIKVSSTEAQVRSSAAHSKPLEFGTSKMAERPFMRPAADRKRKRVRGLIAAAVEASKGA